MFTNLNRATLLQTPFNAISIEHGIDHRLIRCRCPADMRDIERLAKRIQDEFLWSATGFVDLETRQSALDVWVTNYTDERRTHP